MFSYYGAKTKIVDLYPAPTHSTIVEPFAGSARYSLKHHEHDVILYETFEKPFRIWQFLIQATEKDILSLPDLNLGDDVRNFKTLSDPERWLMGYQIQRGSARPGCIVNERCRWNTDKLRIAKEVSKVKHWKIFQSSGLEADWNDATFFVDPPYMVQKHGYNHRNVDYSLIKEKLMNGRGQFIVCGNSDDTWLDFEYLTQMQGIAKKHTECIFVRNG